MSRRRAPGRRRSACRPCTRQWRRCSNGNGSTLIDVASPRETHAPICRLAADRGLAIICQKPLAPTFAEAASLVADVGGRVRLMVHENWRFRPHYRRIAEWLRDGRVGEVRTVTMALLTSGLIPDASGRAPAIERQPMFATLERLLVMEVLIHHVDTLRFLLGPLALTGASLGGRARSSGAKIARRYP